MSSNQGIQFLNDGGCYEGEYKDGKYHGQGTYTWSNGGKYEGKFKHGKIMVKEPLLSQTG